LTGATVGNDREAIGDGTAGAKQGSISFLKKETKNF
jgi:hypothetical protein